MLSILLDQRQKRALAIPLLALVVLATAVPRELFYQHEHAAGDREHAHAWEGNAIDALLALAHRHEHGAGEDHVHAGADHVAHDHSPAAGEPEAIADSGDDGAHAAAADGGPGIRALREAGTRHAHAQTAFRVATRSAVPAPMPDGGVQKFATAPSRWAPTVAPGVARARSRPHRSV